LAQTGQITSHKSLADGAGHTFCAWSCDAWRTARVCRWHRP